MPQQYDWKRVPPFEFRLDTIGKIVRAQINLENGKNIATTEFDDGTIIYVSTGDDGIFYDSNRDLVFDEKKGTITVAPPH